MMRGGYVDAVSRKFVAGWAADADQPAAVLVLSVWVDGVRVGYTKANRLRTDLARLGNWGTGHHGFRFKFTEALTADRPHDVAVRFEDGTVLPQGEKAVSEPEAAVAEGAAPTPILVTAPARSGGTLLMAVLGQSPHILAPAEPRLLAHYASVFATLTAPVAPVAPYGQALADYHERLVPEAGAAMLRRLMAEYCRALAADHDRTGIRFLAERNSDVHQPTRQVVRRVFPGAREIAIVRDPRDVLCSRMAHCASAPGDAFVALTAGTQQLAAMRRDTGPDLLIIRYEDMLRGEPGCFAALSMFLGISVKPLAEDAAIALFRRHATSASPEASVERWREALPAELVHRGARAWGDFLRVFGYAVD